MNKKIQRIILVRHGYSMGNFDADNYASFGDYNVPLQDKGWEQAIRAGVFLKDYLQENPSTSVGKPRIWSSYFQRTKETTSGLIHGAQGYMDDCDVRGSEFLFEQSFGLFSHLHDREKQKEFLPLQAEFHSKVLEKEKFTTKKLMGEAPFDVWKNTSHFLDKVHRDAQKGVQDIVCVSHGVTTRILAMRFLNMNPEALNHFKNPGNCDVMVLQRQDDGRMTLFKVFDGEKGEEANIDLGSMLEEKAPKLSIKTLPPVPNHLKMKP